jgi:hypothetical protein
MPKTHALSFKDLKQRVSIEHVLRHYELFEGLRMRGKSHRGPCPLCEAGEGVPFSVSLEKNCFHCFSCRASGNVLDFIAKWEGVTIREAGQLLNKNFVDAKVSHHRPQGIQQEAQKVPDQPATPDVPKAGCFNGTKTSSSLARSKQRADSTDGTGQGGQNAPCKGFKLRANSQALD